MVKMVKPFQSANTTEQEGSPLPDRMKSALMDDYYAM